MFIYALLDPEDKTVRYIGKSGSPKKRWAVHRASGVRPTADWCRQLASRNREPILTILEKCDGDGKFEEKAWIAKYWSPGLLNRGRGGEGALPGAKFPALLGNQNRTGKPHTAESLARMRGNKNAEGHTFPEHQKRAMVGNKRGLGNKSKLGQTESAETRQKRKDTWAKKRSQRPRDPA